MKMGTDEDVYLKPLADIDPAELAEWLATPPTSEAAKDDRPSGQGPQPKKRGPHPAYIGPEYIPDMLEWLADVGNATFEEYARKFGIHRGTAYTRVRRAAALGFIEADTAATKWGRPATLWKVAERKASPKTTR